MTRLVSFKSFMCVCMRVLACVCEYMRACVCACIIYKIMLSLVEFLVTKEICTENVEKVFGLGTDGAA